MPPSPLYREAMTDGMPLSVCCSVFAVRCSALQCVAVRCSALQCVAVRCSALQCVAMCCNVLQCVALAKAPGMFYRVGNILQTSH